MQQLIDRLKQSGLLNDESARRARALLEEGKRLEDAVLAADGVGEEAMLRALGQMLAIPLVDLDAAAPDKAYLATVPTRLLVRRRRLGDLRSHQ